MAENRIEDLAESACLKLLRGHHFGRVAFTDWAPGDRSQYVRIIPELVTGRCISVAELPSNWWG